MDASRGVHGKSVPKVSLKVAEMESDGLLNPRTKTKLKTSSTGKCRKKPMAKNGQNNGKINLVEQVPKYEFFHSWTGIPTH